MNFKMEIFYKFLALLVTSNSNIIFIFILTYVLSIKELEIFLESFIIPSNYFKLLY